MTNEDVKVLGNRIYFSQIDIGAGIMLKIHQDPDWWTFKRSDVAKLMVKHAKQSPSWKEIPVTGNPDFKPFGTFRMALDSGKIATMTIIAQQMLRPEDLE